MDLKELSHRKHSEERRHPWELARLEVVFSLIESCLGARLKEKITILDIGCGDLFFAENISKKIPAAQIIAVDTAFDRSSLQYYSEKYKHSNIKVFDTLENAQVCLNSPADVVLLLDVVEHIENDFGFLTWVKSYKFIDLQTRFFITVPAFQSLFCEHDKFLDHFRRYTNKSASTVLENAGYKILKRGYFFSILLPIRTLDVLIERMKIGKKDRTGLTEWNGSPAKSSFVKNLLLMDFKFFWWLRKFTGIKAPGLSNYIVCQKSA